jgi:hypothetical protein
MHLSKINLFKVAKSIPPEMTAAKWKYKKKIWSKRIAGLKPTELFHINFHSRAILTRKIRAEKLM